MIITAATVQCNDNNINTKENSFGADIMTKPLQEFT